MRFQLFLAFLLCVSSVSAALYSDYSFLSPTSPRASHCNATAVGSDTSFNTGKFKVLSANSYLFEFAVAHFNWGCGPPAGAYTNGKACRIELSGTPIATGTTNGESCILSSTPALTPGLEYDTFFTYTGGHELFNCTRNCSGNNAPIGQNVNFSSIGSLYYVSTSVNSFEICETPTGNSITYNFFSEEVPSTRKNQSTIEISIYEGWNLNYSTNVFSAQLSDRKNVTICSANSTTVDIHLKYHQEDLTYSNWYFDNQAEFDGTDQSKTAYNLNATSVADSSQADITIRKSTNYGYFQGIFAHLERFYMGNGTWRAVQMRSSDEFGSVKFRVREEDTQYRLVFYDSENTQITQTSPFILSCSTGICELTYVLNPDYASVSSTASYSFLTTYNNLTGIIDVSWTELTGIPDLLTINFSRILPRGNAQICSSTSTDDSGSATCNVSQFTGFVQVEAISYAQSNQSVLTQYTELIELSQPKIVNFVGEREAVFWTFGIATTAAMFGLFSPVGTIITLIIGLIIGFVLGIAGPISITFIIIASAIGVTIGLKIKD